MLKGSEWPNLASRYTYTDRYSQQIYLLLQIYLLWALNSRDTIHAILGQMLSVRICHACMHADACRIQPASQLAACVRRQQLARMHNALADWPERTSSSEAETSPLICRSCMRARCHVGVGDL